MTKRQLRPQAGHSRIFDQRLLSREAVVRGFVLRGNPDILIFVEEWETQELWEAHMAGEAIQSFNARIGSGSFAAGEVHPLQQIA